MGIAESIAVDKGVLKGEKISLWWWQRFLERQPNLTLWRSDSTAHVRMDAVNQETMDQYFSLLGEVLMEHNLVDKSSQIYNVDESGVPLDPKPPNVITKKGSKKVRYQVSGRKGQVTIAGYANAIWQAIPPWLFLMYTISTLHGQKENFLEPDMA